MHNGSSVGGARVPYTIGQTLLLRDSAPLFWWQLVNTSVSWLFLTHCLDSLGEELVSPWARSFARLQSASRWYLVNDVCCLSLAFRAAKIKNNIY